MTVELCQATTLDVWHSVLFAKRMYLLLVQSSGCSYPVNDVSHKALQKSFCGVPMLLCVRVLHSANKKD